MPRREKLETVPPAWAKVHRASAMALIAAERRCLARMRGAAADGSSSAVATLANSAHAGVESQKRVAIATVRAVAKRLSDDVASAVLDSRKSARHAAVTRLGATAALIEREVRAAGLYDRVQRPSVSDGEEDSGHAENAGRSYASAWSAGALAAILRWADDAESQSIALAGPVSNVRVQLDYRIRRTATTETAQAFSDETDEGIGYIAKQHAKSTWIAALVKRWDAQLDRRVCATCAGLDGELALPGFPWSGDAEPGFVHACCRCTSAPLLIPARLSEAAAAARYTDDEDDEAA